VTVDEAVVADLVTEAVAQPGSLPLLQFTLAELYDRRVDGRIGPDALTSIGGMAGSIGRRAEEVYLSLDDQARDETRVLFSRLITPGDGMPDARRRARLSELSAGARAVADRYVAARLLVSDRDHVTREPTVEVAHEALLTRWQRLAEWVDADRRWLIQLQHLSTAARAWDGNGRPAADLYRGARLESAIEALDVEGRDVTDVERQFVDAGREARDSELHAARRSARRLRWSLVGVGALLVMSLVAGTLAFAAQRRASREEREAAHRALVSDSVALRANKRELAALLAIEAHRLAPSADTESALFGTFTAAPALERTVRSAALLGEGVGILLDDERLVSAGRSGTVAVLDIDTGAELFRLPFLEEDNGFIVWLAATPDARYLATAWRSDYRRADATDSRGVFSVWDLDTRERRFANVDVPFAMGAVALSADGRLVAIAGGPEGRTLVFDAATGTLRAEVPPLPRPDDARLIINTVGLAFAPDGRLIVGSQAGPIRLVDPTTGAELRRIDASQETSEFEVRVSPDGLSFITTGVRGSMRYDLQSGEPLWSAPADTESCGPPIAFADRLGVVLCGQARAWDLDSGTTVESPFDQQAGLACALLDTPDGTTLVQSSCSSNDYVLWRLGGDGAASRLLAPATGEHVVIGYTTDGQSLFAEEVMKPDSFLTQLIDLDTGAVKPLPGIFGPTATDDPSQVVVAFDDGTGGMYDLEAGTRVGPRVAFDFEVWGWEGAGERTLVWGGEQHGSENFQGHLAAAAGGRIAFDIELGDMAVQHAAAPDPAHLVTLDCRLVCMLQRRDPVTGTAIGEPVGHGEAGFSSVVGRGGVLVAVADDGQVVVLDPDTLAPVGGPLPGISALAHALSLSDDGRRLLLVGDRSFRLYDVPSRTQLGDAVPIGAELGGALRPDGMEAAVGTEHGIAVWDLDPAHWIEGACAIAGRNLTRAEWEQYIGDLAGYRATCPQFEAGV
jgi:WD40 repeat protein